MGQFCFSLPVISLYKSQSLKLLCIYAFTDSSLDWYNDFTYIQSVRMDGSDRGVHCGVTARRAPRCARRRTEGAPPGARTGTPATPAK